MTRAPILISTLSQIMAVGVRPDANEWCVTESLDAVAGSCENIGDAQSRRKMCCNAIQKPLTCLTDQHWGVSSKISGRSSDDNIKRASKALWAINVHRVLDLNFFIHRAHTEGSAFPAHFPL